MSIRDILLAHVVRYHLQSIFSVLLHLTPSGIIDHPQASLLDLEKSDVALGGPESLLELKDSRPNLFSANPRCRARLPVESEVPSANV